MAIEYKDINQLTQKSSVAGTEKIEVSDTEYITPSQIVGGKQDTLVSGTNIKTINNQSLLGSGNITIQGGGSSDVSVYTFQADGYTSAYYGNVTINNATYQSFLDDVDNGKSIIIRTVYQDNAYEWQLLECADGEFAFVRAGYSSGELPSFRQIFVMPPSTPGGDPGISAGEYLPELWNNKVNSISGAGSTSYYPSTKAVVDYVATQAGLPTPDSSGLFLVTDWDVASSSNKWKISDIISIGSPGTLYVDTDYGINASQFATAIGPQGSGSQILIGSSGLIGEASSSNTVFSDWSWIKYRNSYNPQHYVTLQQTLDSLPLLPAVTSSDSGHMLYVGYDSEYGYYWSKNSPFHFESLNMVGDSNMGIVLNTSGDSFLALYPTGIDNSFGRYADQQYVNWNWIKYDYYDSTAGTRLEVGLQDTLDTKQATLVSGTNIKTVNSQSILGSGNINISASTTDCVHVTGDETVGGDKTFTDNIGVVDADHIVYSGGGGGGGFTRGYATIEVDDVDDISVQLANEPKAFIATAQFSGDNGNISMIAIIGDSTGCHCVYSAAGTHQHNYSSDNITASYSNGRFYLSSNGLFHDLAGGGVNLVYYYGEGTLTFKTSQIQPGSGVTALTFTGTDLTEVPAMYALMLETQVNNESYRRVAYYTNEGGGASATPMGVSFFSSQIHNTTSSFTATYQTGYSSGLNINSGGTNAGGYFHNPGTYTLYYLMASDIGSGGGGGFQSLGDELDDIRDTIGDIATILASI